MTEQTERRGWEPNEEYHPHILDDPDYDTVEDEAEGGMRMFVALLLVIVAWIGFMYTVNRMTAPPKVVFAAPSVPQPNEVLNAELFSQWKDYSVHCISFDGRTRTIEPYYANPFCQQEFLKRMKQ